MRVITTLAGLVNLLILVRASFFIEISPGPQLELNNGARSSLAYMPQLEPGLFSCRNKDFDDGSSVIFCVSSSPTEEKKVYNTATFFTAYKPDLGLGQSLLINDRDMGDLPEVLQVGFAPASIDTPKVDPFLPSEQDLYELFGDFKYNGCLPNDDEVSENLLDFLLCNDVQKCVLKKPLRTIHTLLPAVRLTIGRVKRLANQISGVKKAMQRISTTVFKSPARAGREEGPIPSLPELKAFMKLMLNKMVDPCILLKYAETAEDTNGIHQTCSVYCQFFNTATEVFARLLMVKCSFIKEGFCVKGVCVCVQQVGLPVKSIKRKIKMLYCDNQFRRKLNKMELITSGSSDDQSLSDSPPHTVPPSEYSGNYASLPPSLTPSPSSS